MSQLKQGVQEVVSSSSNSRWLQHKLRCHHSWLFSHLLKCLSHGSCVPGSWCGTTRWLRERQGGKFSFMRVLRLPSHWKLALGNSPNLSKVVWENGRLRNILRLSLKQGSHGAAHWSGERKGSLGASTKRKRIGTVKHWTVKDIFGATDEDFH